MKLLIEEMGYYIYKIELRTNRKEYYLIDNISGLVATFEISENENRIYHFQTSEAYVFANHNHYINIIAKCFPQIFNKK